MGSSQRPSAFPRPVSPPPPPLGMSPLGATRARDRAPGRRSARRPPPPPALQALRDGALGRDAAVHMPLAGGGGGLRTTRGAACPVGEAFGVGPVMKRIKRSVGRLAKERNSFFGKKHTRSFFFGIASCIKKA